MLTELTVKNFRNIERLTVKPLSRFTLIGGKNGVGKTALLEALWLFTGPNQPWIPDRLDRFRGTHERGRSTFFSNIFRNFNTEQTISISGKERDYGTNNTLNIIVSDNASSIVSPEIVDESNLAQAIGDKQLLFEYHDGNSDKSLTSSAWWVTQQQMLGPLHTVSEGIQQTQARMPEQPGAIFMASRRREDVAVVASRFGTLQLSGHDFVIKDFLRNLEPRLDRFSPITINGVPIVHAYLDSTPPMPVNLVGEGFGRLFEMSVALGNQKGGMLLIDEIENGIHHSAMEKVFAALLELAEEFDVQIVATTHSRECILSAHRALSGEGEGEFTYHRIDRRGDDLIAVNYDAEMRDTAEFHRMEIR